MRKENDSKVTGFVLLGLSSSWELQIFLIFVLLYMVTVLGNLLIVVTVWVDAYLFQWPMYFFWGHLSFLDLCLSCVTVPKMLGDFLQEGKVISFSGCLAQIYFLHFLGASEMFLLTVMAYDRYVAICNPLHYLTVMNRWLCVQLVFVCWCGGALAHSFVQTLLTFQLPFCNSQVIDHYFCDVHPVLKLACADTTLVNMLVIANSSFISLGCFLILLASYTVILFSLRKRSAESRRKALSTCGSHFTVVTFFFVPCIFIYLRPSTTFPLDKAVSVFYTTITPMLNPLIYTLRNEDVKNAMRRLWSQICTTMKMLI
uniref:Olfactory receptor n=1 Tax=Catagonus wagneri TaxID=51154 RepID=A0A8C3WRX1_9CETA